MSDTTEHFGTIGNDCGQSWFQLGGVTDMSDPIFHNFPSFFCDFLSSLFVSMISSTSFSILVNMRLHSYFLHLRIKNATTSQWTDKRDDWGQSIFQLGGDDEQAPHLAPENTILQTLTATCNLPTAFLIKCNQFRRPEKHLKSQSVAVAISRGRCRSQSLIGHRRKSQSQSQPEPTIAPLSNASYHRDSQTISQAIHCLFLLSRFWPWFLWPKRPLFLH